ncbi:hypothetical protein [Shewanella algicola]|uniref:hypothetical protein n=1 Tax=Shewanella algicola TaxID=640633 RepID=UPI00249528FD|nr:hypothetical protein [Shewanella algicola]
MNKVEIICDASFCHFNNLTAYSGSVTYTDSEGVNSERLYTGNSGTLKNSNEGEAKAILSGLSLLNDLLKHGELCSEYIELVIFTDSLTVIELYDKYSTGSNKDKLYEDLGATIYQLCSLMHKNVEQIRPVKMSFKHVKAHVSNSLAKPIENRHNQHDAFAVESNNQCFKTIISPNLMNSKVYGVLLPLELDSAKLEKLLKSAVLMAHAGYKARIKFSEKCDEITEHPFIKALNIYAEALDKDVTEIYEVENYCCSSDIKQPIFTMLRELQLLDDSIQANREYELAMDLIYGEAILGESYIEKQNNPIAFCIFDLTKDLDGTNSKHTPVTISEWVDSLLDHIFIAHRFGIDSLIQFAQSNILKGVTGKRPYRPNHFVFQQLKQSNEGANLDVLARNIVNKIFQHTDVADQLIDSTHFFLKRTSPYVSPDEVIRLRHTAIKRLTSLSNRSSMIKPQRKLDYNEASELKLNLIEVLDEIDDGFDKTELINLLLDEIEHHGYPVNEHYRIGVCRTMGFATRNIWRESGLLVDHFLSVADKFKRIFEKPDFTRPGCNG